MLTKTATDVPFIFRHFHCGGVSFFGLTSGKTQTSTADLKAVRSRFCCKSVRIKVARFSFHSHGHFVCHSPFHFFFSLSNVSFKPCSCSHSWYSCILQFSMNLRQYKRTQKIVNLQVHTADKRN